MEKLTDCEQAFQMANNHMKSRVALLITGMNCRRILLNKKSELQKGQGNVLYAHLKNNVK